jgi:dihydroorotate dehydrogenase
MKRSFDKRKTGYDLLRPILFKLDPETAHALFLRSLSFLGSNPVGRFLLHSFFRLPLSQSTTSVFDLDFTNPIGLAAGYDKNGIAPNGLATLGFGHIELGTVTPEPQLGRATPRVFRLQEDGALINRMGFPNNGAQALRKRLEKIRKSSTITGVNIGKGGATPLEQAAEDYAILVRTFYPVADYLAINISSPNTLGLRRLQSKHYLGDLLHSIELERKEISTQSDRHVPFLIKLAPDLSEQELEDVIEVIISSGMDGVIATNTTINRDGLASKNRSEEGGLSGLPLRERAREVVHKIFEISSGSIPIIGVGGIFGSDDVRAMLDSGASLVQIYTGLVYRGPGMVSRILKELAES